MKRVDEDLIMPADLRAGEAEPWPGLAGPGFSGPPARPVPAAPVVRTYSKLVRLLLSCRARPRALAAPAWMKFHCRLGRQTGMTVWPVQSPAGSDGDSCSPPHMGSERGPWWPQGQTHRVAPSDSQPAHMAVWESAHWLGAACTDSMGPGDR